MDKNSDSVVVIGHRLMKLFVELSEFNQRKLLLKAQQLANDERDAKHSPTDAA